MPDTIAHPPWFVPLGKWAYVPDDKDPFSLTITTKSAHVKIRERPRPKLWCVRWMIFHKGDNKVEGTVNLTAEELMAAFCLDGSMHAVVEAKFYRQEEFLNIPCRGTGFVGDPNASIKVTKEIAAKVKWLLEHGRMPR